MQLSGDETNQEQVIATTRRKRAVIHFARLSAVLVLALVASVGIAACSESTAPAKAAAPATPVTPPAPKNALDSLGLWVGDATLWVLPSIEDETIRTNVQTGITDLGTHLAAGKYDLTRKDIGGLRGLMDSVSIDVLSALGPVEVALEVIEQALDAAGV